MKWMPVLIVALAVSACHAPNQNTQAKNITENQIRRQAADLVEKGAQLMSNTVMQKQ